MLMRAVCRVWTGFDQSLACHMQKQMVLCLFHWSLESSFACLSVLALLLGQFGLRWVLFDNETGVLQSLELLWVDFVLSQISHFFQ